MDEAESDTISWQALAHQAFEQLNSRPLVGNARWESNLIVQKACGVDNSDWLTVRDQPATTRGVANVDRMVGRRLNGEPIQYVLGEWGFRQLDLLVDRRVLIPRPETESMVDAVLAELKRIRDNIDHLVAVDLGTGSGAIGLSLAVEGNADEVWLTDVSDDSLAVARANLAGVGRAGAHVRLGQGSWFEALPDELRRSVGVIVSNPPYVADSDPLPQSVVDWEPARALFSGPDGVDDLEHLVCGADDWLLDDGAIAIELSPPQADRIAGIAASRFGEVDVGKDLAGQDRWVVARHPIRL